MRQACDWQACNDKSCIDKLQYKYSQKRNNVQY